MSEGDFDVNPTKESIKRASTDKGVSTETNGANRETIIASLLYLMSRYSLSGDTALANVIAQHLAMLANESQSGYELVQKTSARLQKY